MQTKQRTCSRGECVNMSKAKDLYQNNRIEERVIGTVSPHDFYSNI